MFHPSLSEYPELPVRRPVMYQRWQSLSFLHWRYQPAVIRRFVPPELELDLFDGAAWIGLTPFLLTGLRFPVLPPVPWISRFPEMNVRTYVRGPDGRRGIWFFTLEADRALAVIGARLTYFLPYRWAKMSVRVIGDRVEYKSQRHFGQGQAHVTIQRDAPIRPTDREIFLTARYRLYTKIAGRLAFAQVDHPPWPLESATLLELEQSVVERTGLPAPAGVPVLHFSPGTFVRIGRPRLFGD